MLVSRHTRKTEVINVEYIVHWLEWTNVKLEIE